MEKLMTALITVGMTFCLWALLMLLMPFVTQWAWNTFMPGVFGLKTIGWTEAFALSLLAGVVRGLNLNYQAQK